jgi:hypothetical protein
LSHTENASAKVGAGLAFWSIGGSLSGRGIRVTLPLTNM